jgi:hypothetical protein
MGMRSSINAEWGIVKFLGDKKLIETGRRGEINKFLVEFLNEYKLPIKKYNPKYKGMYDALNQNCETVQENWDKFHVWCANKLKEYENQN